MEICKKGFPGILTDNDDAYFGHLFAIIESVDELSSVEIHYTPTHYHFRIAPSIPKYIEPLLYEILRFNNQFGILLELSKSMKASSTITFNIKTNGSL